MSQTRPLRGGIAATVLAILALGTLDLRGSQPEPSGAELRVCATCPYTTLRSALLKAPSGARVVVASGTYREHDLEVTKPVHIFGEPGSVLNVDHKGYGLIVVANNVNIEGLTISNIKTGSIHDYSAIDGREASNLSVLKVRIVNGFFGIHLFGCRNFLIEHNIISSTGTSTMSGNGIHVQYSKHGEIRSNHVQGCRDGIYLEFTDSTQVIENQSQHNSRYGLHYMFSHYNAYRKNHFQRNEAGVAVMYSSHTEMTDNVFSDNWGNAAYGLLLKDIHDGLVANNRFDHNTSALFLEGTNRIQIKNNYFANSGWALRLLANCQETMVEHNRFTNNSFDLTTNGQPKMAIVRRNFWDAYEGYDRDRDGYGDIPYFPINLMSALVERQPALVSLHRSLITTLLDWVDRLLPSLTPDELVDEQPLMKH